MEQDQQNDLQLFNTCVHAVDGAPMNWLPLPEDDFADDTCRHPHLQHLATASRFYIAQVEELAQSTCMWRTRRQYCVKTGSREATLYHLAEAAASLSSSSGLTATCLASDGRQRRAFQVAPARSFPLFAADLLPLPWCGPGVRVLAAVGDGHGVGQGDGDGRLREVGRVAPAWGPVKAFWAGDAGNGRKFQVQSERLMEFCCSGDAAEEEPLEALQGDALLCLATVRRQKQLRTVYCQAGGMELSFLDAALELPVEERLLLLCAMLYAWQQMD